MSTSIEDKLYTLTFKPDKESHLVPNQDLCRQCADKPCLNFCPAHVYSWEDDHLAVAFEGCVECGACRIGCPYHSIAWRYPRGGFGVMYKFG